MFDDEDACLSANTRCQIPKKKKNPKRRKKLVIVAVAKQTWIGFGSNERTTPAISVILCFIKQIERLERKQDT